VPVSKKLGALYTFERRARSKRLMEPIAAILAF
jgi:hypothetical protein